MSRLIYFPNIIISLLKTGHELNPAANLVKFRIPPYMNKYDLHSYLSNIYKINCKVIKIVNFSSRRKLGNRKSAENKSAIVEII